MVKKQSKFAADFEMREAVDQLAKAKSNSRRREMKIDTRSALRINHAEPIVLLTEGGVKHALVHNISVSGAGIFLSEGDAPEVGEVLSLRFLDNQHIQACVTWVNGLEFGLKFDDELDTLDEFLHFELRGPQFFRAVRRPTGTKS